MDTGVQNEVKEGMKGMTYINDIRRQSLILDITLSSDYQLKSTQHHEPKSDEASTCDRVEKGLDRVRMKGGNWDERTHHQILE